MSNSRKRPKRCIHRKPLGECQICETVSYVLDKPETAARDIVRLRNIETAARALLTAFYALVASVAVTD